MPLTKSKGNMYPWVTHTHSHLAGRCSHGCRYCYVQAMERRYKSGRYDGDVRLLENELDVKYGEGKTIFIEHMNDLLAPDVTDGMVAKIISHCLAWPNNTYVFQSKNPWRFKQFEWPVDSIFGTTIETNRDVQIGDGNAPKPFLRWLDFMSVAPQIRKFVTIEPVMEFDLEVMVRMITKLQPNFVNIGADSKGSGLPEPSGEKVIALITRLKDVGIEIREKHNLERLVGLRKEKD